MAQRAYKTGNRPPPISSRAQRQGLVGEADQLKYQSDEALERDEMKARLADQRSRSRSKKKPKDASGLSSGVMGSSLRAQYFLQSKDKGRSAKHLLR